MIEFRNLRNKGNFMPRWISGIIMTGILVFVSCSCGGDDNGTDPDTTPPTVISTNPSEDQIDVPTGAAISVTFSEDMAPSSINASTFLIDCGIKGVVSYSGQTATFTPAHDFSNSMTHTATITIMARDLAGNMLNEAYSWSFTTVSTDSAPTVISIFPQDGESDVMVNSTVQVTFSKAMQSTTITPASFFVGSESGDITYDCRTATFTPTSNLDFNTTYNVTIVPTVSDTFGLNMADFYSSSFTTGPERIMDGASYFPMEDGDTWYFTNVADTQITRTVSGDTLINGITCKKVLQNGVTTEAWTVDSSGFGVHLLDEILWFEPPLLVPFGLRVDSAYNYDSKVFWTENDTLWESNISGILKFKGYVTRDVPAGHFDDVIKLLYQTEAYTEYYARGVGLLFNGDLNLDSAYVGGVWYR
jgi:hypothetical protein